MPIQGRGSHIGTAIGETTASAAGHALTADKTRSVVACVVVVTLQRGVGRGGGKKRHQARSTRWTAWRGPTDSRRIAAVITRVQQGRKGQQ
jgi:hypothetical protein